MPQDLFKIEKKSATIYLAADDGALIFDDNDNTFLVIKIGELVKKIIKKAADLFKINKNTGNLTKIPKS